MNVAGFPLRCNNRGLSQTALATRTNNSGSEASGNFTPAMVMNMLSMCAQMGANPQATSAGLANLQINQKKRKAIEDTPGKPASPESKDVNVAKTTPAVEAVGTAEPASRSAKPLLALENQAPALENKALELPVFDSQPEDEKVSTSAGVPTDVLNALDSREKAKAKSKGAPKAKGKPKAKPKAKSGAQPKAKPGAKPKAKPGAKPKANLRRSLNRNLWLRSDVPEKVLSAGGLWKCVIGRMARLISTTCLHVENRTGLHMKQELLAGRGERVYK